MYAMMLRRAVILFFAFYSACADAGEFGLILNGKAVHLQKKSGQTYNEDNWGTGIQYNFDPLPSGWTPFVQVSGFVDSNYNNSYYAGGGYIHRIEMLSTQNNAFSTSLGAFGFVMSRTKEDKSGNMVIVGVLPALTLGTRYINFNITYAPKYLPNTGPLFFIQAVLPLNDF